MKYPTAHWLDGIPLVVIFLAYPEADPLVDEGECWSLGPPLQNWGSKCFKRLKSSVTASPWDNVKVKQLKTSTSKQTQKNCTNDTKFNKLYEHASCKFGGDGPMVVLRDLFREMGARRNSMDTQQSAHTPNLNQRSTMEEVMPKMAHWRLDAGESRKWARSCSWWPQALRILPLFYHA